MGREWYRLDNAAKLIPSSMVGADTRVFRLVCELKEKVDSDILQTALDRTLEEFSYVNSCLRKGIFWYYMDELGKNAVVHEENEKALQALYVAGKKNLLYRVTYFNKRINLEIFHVLADGTGGFLFLKKIVINYLSIKHGLDYPEDISQGASVEENKSDAFSQFYESDKRVRRNYLREMAPKKAYHIKGNKDPNLDLHLVEGTVKVTDMLDIAHKYGVTLGVLAVALWVEAIIRQMKKSEYNRLVVISVPVNLRQYFPSTTMRNFFGVINVSVDPNEYDGSLESIIPSISREFGDQLTKEKVRDMMNSYSSLERNPFIKFLPLNFKDLGMTIIRSLMYRGVTTSVSNVGKVELEDGYAAYVEKFASFMSSASVFVCISTFRDNMVFGITSCFKNHTTAYNFFSRIKELGADVVIATNDCDME